MAARKPRLKNAMPDRKMLVAFDVIRADQNGQLGEFLAEAQLDFQLYILLPEGGALKNNEYTDFIKGYGLMIGPEHLIGFDQIELLKDDDGRSDFEAVLSYDEDIAMMAREMGCGTDFIATGYENFKTYYDAGLVQSGLWLKSADHMGSMTRFEQGKLDRDVERVLVDLKGEWESVARDTAVLTFLQTLPGESLRHRLQNDLKLYFNYSALMRSDMMLSTVMLIHRDLAEFAVSPDILENALAKIEYRAKSAQRRDYL